MDPFTAHLQRVLNASEIVGTLVDATSRLAAHYSLERLSWIVAALAILPVLYTAQRLIEVVGLVVRVASEGALGAAAAGILMGFVGVALRTLEERGVLAHGGAITPILEDSRVIVGFTVAIVALRALLGALRGDITRER